jgi:hypothetical protein
MPHVGDLHAYEEDNFAYEHVLLHLASIFEGILTYLLVYHGYFMYYDLMSRDCKEIKAFLYFLRV